MLPHCHRGGNKSLFLAGRGSCPKALTLSPTSPGGTDFLPAACPQHFPSGRLLQPPARTPRPIPLVDAEHKTPDAGSPGPDPDASFISELKPPSCPPASMSHQLVFMERRASLLQPDFTGASAGMAGRPALSGRSCLGSFLPARRGDRRFGGQVFHTPGNLSEPQAPWRDAADTDSRKKTQGKENATLPASQQPNSSRSRGTHQTDPGCQPPCKLPLWRPRVPLGPSQRGPCQGGLPKGACCTSRR